MEQVTKEKDFGIKTDNELKFHKHTATAIKKANKILSLIKKSFVNLDTKSLPLYKSLVRPHLEYGNIIWGSVLQRRPEGPRKSSKKSHKTNTKYPKFTIRRTIAPT